MAQQPRPPTIKLPKFGEARSTALELKPEPLQPLVAWASDRSPRPGLTTHDLLDVMIVNAILSHSSTPAAAPPPSRSKKPKKLEPPPDISESSAGAGQPQCKICYDHVASITLAPCGHCNYCSACVRSIINTQPKPACSYCREPIQNWVRTRAPDVDDQPPASDDKPAKEEQPKPKRRKTTKKKHN